MDYARLMLCGRWLNAVILVCILMPAHVNSQDLAVRIQAEKTEQDAESHIRNQRYREALEALASAKSVYEQLGDVEKTVDLTRQIAVVHFNLGELDKALGYATRAVTACENLGNPKTTASANYALGMIYRDLKEYDLATRHFQKTERLADQTGRVEMRALAVNEIGNIMLLRDRPDRALEVKKRALELGYAAGSSYVISSCLHDIGVVHLQKGNYPEALRFFRRALQVGRDNNYKREIVVCLLNIGAIQRLLGQSDEAVETLQEALEYSEELNIKPSSEEILASLSGSYAELGHWRQAYESLGRAYRLREQIFSDEKARNIGETYARFETSQKDRENEILKRDNRIMDLELTRRLTQRNLLLVVAILAIIVVIVLLNRNRVKSKANRQLAAANRAIMAQKAELDEANQRLDLLARTDWLTGLPNRREMTERIAKELAGEFGLFRPFVLILCDVDDFKAINDRYGHGTGDSVLRTLGQRLRDLLRGYDSAGRWGGEEFLLLLPASEIENGTAVALRIHQDISQCVFDCDAAGLTLTMTFGVVLCDNPHKSIEEYLKAADRALYRGKQQGKNQVVTFGNSDDLLHAQAG